MTTENYRNLVVREVDCLQQCREAPICNVEEFLALPAGSCTSARQYLGL